MKKVLFGLFALGLTTQMFAQIIKPEELSEVIVMAKNYKYLNDVNSQEVVSVPVELLERKVASYNVKDSEFYQDDYGTYNITFYIPQGKILAEYNADGKIIKTVERFTDINLPLPVKNAILEKFPKWTITKDTYKVSYSEAMGSNKTYKLKLENGDETIRVKVDEEGNFL